MTVIQSIQSGQFALESRSPSLDDDALRAARLTVVGMGLRDGAALTDIRDAFDALGLL